MIGEIEALLDEGVDSDRPVLSGSFARMQQHVLDDGVCALTVLHHLVEIVAQGIRQFGYFGKRTTIGLYFAEVFLQFVDQFSRDPGEVGDEIERVLDLVGDAGRELAERGEFLRLDETVLCSSQIFQRFS